jgi:tetratricopeptide (TPR) repeat protein
MCIEWKRIVVFCFVLLACSCKLAMPRTICDTKALFENANTFVQRRQYKEAAAALNVLNECPNLSAVERFNIGWLYGRARDFNTALAVFKTVPDDVPDRLMHRYAVALSEFELGEYSAAAEVLTKLKSQEPLDAKCANLLGVAYSKLGLYDNAYAVLSEVIHKDPGDISGYLNLVTLCADGGNFAKAASAASDAVRAFPNSPQVLIVAGAANTLLGQLDKAHDNFSKAVQLAPDNADAVFFLALTDYKQAKFGEAVAQLRLADKSGAEDSDLHYLLAECLLRVTPDKPELALAALNHAIELNKNSISARTLRGRLLLDAGRAKDALEDLEWADRLDPGSRSAAYTLARAYRALGRGDQAKALFKKVREEAAEPLREMSDRRLNSALTESGGQK